MSEIKLPPTVFKIRDLGDVTRGPILEAQVCIEGAKSLLNIISTYCEDPSTCSQFDIEVLCCLMRDRLYKADDMLMATEDYLGSVACVNSTKESAPAATETQENQEPKPLHTCDNDIIHGAALSNEIGGKA